MKKCLASLLFISAIVSVFGQYKMRPLEELRIKNNPGWSTVKEWIDSAKNNVEVLKADTSSAKDALYKTQVSTRSIMGSIVYCTGGILVDHGWIRILGSGNPKMTRTLPDWNVGKAFSKIGDPPAYYLVADDAAGGYFAMNYGLFGTDLDSMYYLSPDNLEWEPLGMNYEDFIYFCFNGDVKKFYTGIKWKSWRKDMLALKPDEVFHILPPLWSKQGKNLEKNQQTPVPAEEQFLYNLDLRKQMGIK